jgi:hypothetical protein
LAIVCYLGAALGVPLWKATGNLMYRSLGYRRDILGRTLNSTAQARQISAPPRQIGNAFGATSKRRSKIGRYRRRRRPASPSIIKRLLSREHDANAFLYAFNLLAMDGTDLRRERLDDRIWAR